MHTLPEAEEITLVSLKPQAPPFHRFIVKKKLVGAVWQVGDTAVIYEVIATRPAGTVRVTERTTIQFKPPTDSHV
jgi:hypothetical protein